ncbi:type III secretion system inner membrane ring lipoprotein SctJ [Roseateles terrae]|uniref:Lipoprotein n=1 Tax=Roseateles terrae TaxID=431060 RepID=A0ABR6GQQ3_9BURK|nr:type III secretion inner membrane ring lipoprotein SctJ [Roseateles terrae]MBB3194438.1 type III secretion protein J [Roseateles terrae]OWQ88265.1 EscJ/YscJ/HrcJ family type III secretion inner membrane ring protein [Roseateles terrae]
MNALTPQRRSLLRGSRWLSTTALVLVLAGCNSSSELYGGLSERDANDITAALSDHGIQASKSAQGKQMFSVSVPTSDFSRSVALLHAVGLPNSSFTRMGDIFKKDGMISTPTEERARFLYALSQELESTLSQIDGVVLARVHPVLPERVVPGEPVLPSSCSVLIKHIPGWDTAAYETRIRKLVLASIPGLADTPEKVAVVFVPSEALSLRQMTREAIASGGQGGMAAGAAVAASHGIITGASAANAATGAPPSTTSMMAGANLSSAAGLRAANSSGAGHWQGWLIGLAAVIIGVGGPSAWLWWHRRAARAVSSSATAAAGTASRDDAAAASSARAEGV